ncbi:MAG: hypothetical protein P8P74_13120 [Crocinitomicaceae bacterium]|nr:hypothetical protein [Crocinitomicaceae bacterium]
MKKALFTAAVLSLSLSATAQSFSVPLDGFSKKKTSYLHMEDGTVSEGLLGGFKRAKGQIETVKMKSESGGKIKIDPVKIKFMYIPPSALGKLSAANDRAGNLKKWDAPSNMDSTLMGKGYVYFEKMTTQIKKKKTEDLMLQMLNTSFSSKIKVFYDPFAKETIGLEVGGVTVAGGLDKSYYVQKVGSTDPAYKLEKKNYKEQFSVLFGDCDEFVAKFGDKIKWSDLETHIYEYTQMCE